MGIEAFSTAGETWPSKKIPKVLLVANDDALSSTLFPRLRGAGFLVERATDIASALEPARSGAFSVVISEPLLPDGSWTDLKNTAEHARSGFLVLLVAKKINPGERATVLKQGAFDLLDAASAPEKVPEVTQRALWAAYLEGDGPSPERGMP
jgi:DNA-binding NtrC family response regulator